MFGANYWFLYFYNKFVKIIPIKIGSSKKIAKFDCKLNLMCGKVKFAKLFKSNKTFIQKWYKISKYNLLFNKPT